MLVGPNKKETDIHDYHCLSSVDVRMRKVLATPLRSGAINPCRSDGLFSSACQALAKRTRK